MIAMNILVCFKVTPDLDQLPPDGWEVDRAALTVETSFVKSMINPYDESALELALRFAEDAPGPVKLTALTVGDRSADRYLKMLYALKFDRAVRLETGADLRFTPEGIAAAIAAFVSRNPHQLIIMGRQSGVGDNAATPLLAAEKLGWPCIAHVTEIRSLQEDLLKVRAQADDGFLSYAARPPLVAAVGNVPHAYLRVPTLKERLGVREKKVEIVAAALPAEEGAGCTLTGLDVIDRRRAGLKIEGATPREKARALYELYLKERLAKL